MKNRRLKTRVKWDTSKQALHGQDITEDEKGQQDKENQRARERDTLKRNGVEKTNAKKGKGKT